MTQDTLLTATEVMTFNQYQEEAHTTADYDEPFYPWWGLAAEAIEVQELVGKQWLRGDDRPPPTKEEIVSELSDVLWMLAEIATQQDIDLQEVADYNIKKLADRAKRGKIRGNGNFR